MLFVGHIDVSRDCTVDYVYNSVDADDKNMNVHNRPFEKLTGQEWNENIVYDLGIILRIDLCCRVWSCYTENTWSSR